MNISTNLIFSLFEQNILSFPKIEDEILGINLQYDKKLNDFKNLDIFQNFKPHAILFEENGLNTHQTLPQKLYQYVLCDLPKQKIAAQYYLACALSVLDKNGILISVAANDAGGKRLSKWFKEFGLNPESISKSKHRIVWAKKQNLNQNKINEFLSLGKIQEITLENKIYNTKPGIFGWNKIDKGSEKLLSTIPSIKNIGADYGCGYGFLSSELLSKNIEIKKLYCLDADYNALECCKKNLKFFKNEIIFDWVDLTNYSKIQKLDWIVMNPPFHDAKDIAVNVGQKFIENAAQNLKNSGMLYMVANAHLPYEKILENHFSSFVKILEEDGFKVFHAQK